MNRLSRKLTEQLMELTLQQAYEMGYEDGQSSVSVEGNTIEHEGKVLRKVNREAREGDFITVIAETDSAVIRKGEIYGPVVERDYVKGADGMCWEVYREGYNRTPSTVEVFELVSDSPPQIEKTANQQRAELIKKAKKFVGELDLDYIYRFDFKVNVEKRTVVVLLRGLFESIKGRGIAKCMPGDIFNEHIGKAIALARALEINIPTEFLEAVQPDKVVLGMLVKSLFGTQGGVAIESDNVNFSLDYLNGKTVTILDDTNAQYQVGE